MLADAIENSRLKRDVTLWRGVSSGPWVDAWRDGKLTGGFSLPDKGFVSTSTSFDTPRKYAGEQGFLLRVRAKKNQSALPIADVAANIDEHEVLLPPGTTLRVLQVPQTVNGRVTVDVEVVDDD